MNDTATPLRHWRHPATIGGDIVIAFRPDVTDSGWWDPDERVIVIDPEMPAAEFVTTLLHEVGHVLCGDDACIPDDAHDLLEEWAVQCASLLRLVRVAQRAVLA